MSASACTLYDSSSPLLSQNFAPGTAALQQSGSISWVNMLDSGVKGAINVLSRYSAGGIDPYTVIVGQLLCTNFRPNSGAMARLKDAIMELKAMKSIGNMLHFGFGVDSIVHNLAATVEGGVLIALCAAATETYHADHAVNILWELVRCFDLPERKTPSLMQWKALSAACAGTLSETSFPELVEHFMQLNAGSNRLAVGRPIPDTSPELRGVSSPDSLAEALLAIGKVSTGDLICVTIVGGPDAGWLAAVAQWVLGLRVAIFDNDYEQVHTTSAHQDPQVQIYFTEPSSNPDPFTLSVKGQVCQLRDITELFYFEDDDFGNALACSRVPWSKALSLTFGRDFKRLMEFPRAVSTAISAAGRIFGGIAKSEKLISPEESINCKTYYRDILGRGLPTYAASLLPELAPLTDMMTDKTFISLKEALDQYDSSLALIKQECACEICKIGARQGMFEENFCLLLLIETIISITHCMSGITVSDKLLPMRSGIEAQYRRQLKLHASYRSKRRISKYGAAGTILEFAADLSEDRNEEEFVAVPRLIHAARLFTGRGNPTSAYELAAISVSGVVVFLNTLLEGGMPVDLESAGRCTVIPGNIDMHGMIYDRVEDLSDSDLHGMAYRRRRTAGQSFDQLQDIATLTNNFDSVKLIAQEESHVVKIGLAVYERHTDPSNARSVIVGPASASRFVLKSTGIVDCDARSCKKNYQLSNLLAADECIKLIDDTGGARKIWLFVGNDLGRLVAVTRASEMFPSFHPILQYGECLDCCVEAARISLFKNSVIIARSQQTLAKRLAIGMSE